MSDPSPDYEQIAAAFKKASSATTRTVDWASFEAGYRAAMEPKMARYTRYWPDGTFCPAGRTHVSWTQIETTASAAAVESVGTEGPITWCGCGVYGWRASEPLSRPGSDDGR